jgi:glycosyltransferase involved in cell wall biosynthesis
MSCVIASMKVLVLPRYDRLGASSRLRMLQYIPWLESVGFELTVVPLFSDKYVLGLQRSKRNMFEVARAYFSRVKQLLASGEYDLLWIEKEMLPWLPAEFELALLSHHIPYILEYDDAVFHYYNLHLNRIVKAVLGRKHSMLMSGAKLVIAGNDYLATCARHLGAKRVKVIPTVIDLERYPDQIHPHKRTPLSSPCVGWIGQRITGEYLVPYKNIFNRLYGEGKAQFSAIGIDAQLFGLPMKSIPWSEESEVADIASFDIGIMPLVDEPFERGKCGYKLIQYMACGLPVVASPVGVNCQIVEHGVNGFLAETLEEWEQALMLLVADADLRQRMGMAGRLKVEQKFSLQVTAPKLIELFRDASHMNAKEA